MNAVAFLFALRPSAWVGPRLLRLPAWRLGASARQPLRLRLCLPSEPGFGRIPLCVSRYFLDILPLLFSALTRELFNEEIFVSQLRFFFLPVHLVVHLEFLLHRWGRTWPVSCWLFGVYWVFLRGLIHDFVHVPGALKKKTYLLPSLR